MQEPLFTKQDKSILKSCLLPPEKSSCSSNEKKVLIVNRFSLVHFIWKKNVISYVWVNKERHRKFLILKRVLFPTTFAGRNSFFLFLVFFK